MWLTLLTLLACSETPPDPAGPVEPPLVEAAPVGSIGGEPILPTPTVLGGISAGAVTTAIGERMEEIDHCYAVEREKKPDLAGKVLVRFVITKNGTVRSAATKSTSLRDEATEKCVIEQVTVARFPPLQTGEMAIVHYPFVFPPP